MTEYKYTSEEAYRLYRENPELFFEQVIHPDASDESKLINKNWPRFWTRYHYNQVENGIMEIIMKNNLPIKNMCVLDVGSGSGHWLAFFQTCFDEGQLFGVDFSRSALDKLKVKFGSAIGLNHWDISNEIPGDLASCRFDIINAVGIIFHIVDDSKWQKAIKNLSYLLNKSGVLIIGGDFGEATVERGVIRKTRSLQEWRELATDLDLKIMDVKRYDWWAGADRGGLTDNLLALGRI